MQNISKITGILIIFILSGCATTLESHWSRGMNTHNDKASSIEDYQYDNEAGMMYFVSNTSDSLFLDIKFPDEITASKVLHQGMTVWLDPSASKSKVFGVHFPIGKKPGSGIGPGRNPNPEVVEGEDGFKRLRYQNRNYKDNISDLVRENLELSLTGFKGMSDRSKIPTTESPFPVKLFYDSSSLLSYHLAIPLKAIHIEDFNDGDALSLGVIAGRLKGPDRSDKMRGREPMGGGRRGGMIPGGSVGGNRRMGSQSRFSDIAQPKMIWIKKVYLATKKVSEKE